MADRAAELVEFAAAMREDWEPLTSGRGSIQSLGIMVAAMESAGSGQPFEMSAK